MKELDLAFSEMGLLLPREEPYVMTLEEIEQHFGLDNHARRNVYSGLKAAVINLFDSGVQRIVIGGSFISRKKEPQDVDIAWWFHADIDWDVLDSVFQVPERRAARGKFCIDQKIDGVSDVPYDQSHEYFLRSNMRMPEGFQEVGIVLIQRTRGN